VPEALKNVRIQLPSAITSLNQQKPLSLDISLFSKHTFAGSRSMVLVYERDDTKNKVSRGLEPIEAYATMIEHLQECRIRIFNIASSAWLFVTLGTSFNKRNSSDVIT